MEPFKVFAVDPELKRFLRLGCIENFVMISP